MRALAARAFATCALAFTACAQEPVELAAPAIPTPAPPAPAQLDILIRDVYPVLPIAMKGANHEDYSPGLFPIG